MIDNLNNKIDVDTEILFSQYEDNCIDEKTAIKNNNQQKNRV